MKLLTLKVSEGDERELERRARESGRTKSAIVREAIAAYVVEPETSSGSVLDAARDLAGVGGGPADLSTNPKHLKGYGR